MMVTSAWTHALSPSCASFEETVAASLEAAGVATSDLRSAGPTGAGILLLTDYTAEACAFIRAATSARDVRVLVVVQDGSRLTSDELWRLLDAGASDALIWQDDASPGDVIAARLERWRRIDSVVDSSLVRDNLIGRSQVWTRILRRLVEVANFSSAPVLLVGETGTGKELAARLMHTLDPQRHKHEMVIVDCTTLLPDLSGSELFGHERGAFTGAVAARDGAVALADGGSLFLDEVGELSPPLQVQLLRVLQEQTYKRVGSNTWRRSDFRLIGATNRDLRAEMERNGFRSDLYHRIASWMIRLPPLRERVNDILPLVNHFLHKAQPGVEVPALDSRVKRYFLTRDYPGNVRDLKNLVFRIAARHVGPGPITIGDIPAEERPEVTAAVGQWCDESVEQAVRNALAGGAGLRDIRRAVDDVTIQLAVDDEAGNLQLAAKRLGVSDRTLQKWRVDRDMRQPAVQKEDFVHHMPFMPIPE
jgi:transcriptional regulator with GAF, ATPase, and Fis domain